MPKSTLEANPCDLTLEKAFFLKSLGFNRINLGVQSFNDRVLKFLGRSHSSKDAENAIRYLRSAGFNNIGLDFHIRIEGAIHERMDRHPQKGTGISTGTHFLLPVDP